MVRMVLWITALSLIVAFSCERLTQPRITIPVTLQLTVEEVLVQEAFLKLQVSGAPAGSVLQVYRNDNILWQRPFKKTDTLLYDGTLLPAQQYTYRAEIWKQGYPLARSNTVTVTTMDTTRHDFSWEIYEFGGQHGSSVLYDVAIINENDIWAVGEIHTAETDTSDSLGNWVPPYNAVHWDGKKWELMRIKTNACGGVDYPPIKTIFKFSGSDIVFGHIDASITHFNGIEFLNDCSFIQEINGSINKMWGTSSNDMYIVGNNGLIAHYDGQRWQRIESGTNLNIYDIWGSFTENGTELEVLCTGSKHLQDPEFRRVIFKLEHHTLTALSSHPIQWTLYSVWFISEYVYYVVGGGVYRKHSLKDKQWQQVQNATRYYSYRIRGIAINDITIVGGFGEVVHFNGLSWRSYINETRLFGNYYSVDMTSNLIVAVGNQGRAAALTIGKRQ